MKYFIVTGASKGLGAATVKRVAQQGHHIVSIARTKNEALISEVEKAGATSTFIAADLTDYANLEKLMEQVMTDITKNTPKEIYFIQNAGMVDPIKPVGEAPSSVVTSAVHLNLLAPMILANQFIALTSHLACKKVIVHISSGAANHPVYGWNTYCTTKAGLDMFTKTVGLEQQSVTNPVTVLSFSPGIMDTEMQAVIRSSDEEDFAEVRTFQDYHEKGELRSPQLVADKMVELILNSPLENGRVYNIRELL